MINLKKLFGNLFATGDHPSDDHLKNFIQDLMVSITLHNTSGQYDVPLNEIEGTFNSFFGKISDEDILRALKEGRTKSTDLVIADFKKNIGHYHDIICNPFQESNPIYQEFFPHGVTEYQNGTKSNMEMLLSRLKTAVNAHAADFQAAFVTLISDQLTRYNDARGAQLLAKEKVDLAILGSAEAREKLEIITSKFLLSIAIEFIMTPEEGWKFFNQNLLHPSRRHPKGGDNTGEYVLPLPVGVKTMADFVLQNQPDYYLLIANTGTQTITGYTCNDQTGLPIPDSKFTILPGDEIVLSYAQMGSMPYLFFFTDSIDTPGEVSITQTDAPMI